MTHLSPFSYVDRGTQNIVVFVAMLYIVGQSGAGFKNLILWGPNASKTKSKAFATWLLLMACFLEIIADSMTVKVKYDEGYSVYDDGSVSYASRSEYSTVNENITLACDVLLNLTFTMRTSSMFLSLALWNWAVCVISDNQSFFNSKQFRAYVGYSMVSMTVYPLCTLIFYFAGATTWSTVVPQFVYHAETMAVITLIILSNRKLNAIMNRYSGNVLNSLKSYQRTSYVLAGAIFMDVFGLFTINMDVAFRLFGYTTPFAAADHDFGVDFFTCMFNMGMTLGYYFCMKLIYPPPEETQNDVSSRVILTSPKKRSMGNVSDGNQNSV